MVNKMNKKHIFRKTFLDFIANGIEEIEYFDKEKNGLGFGKNLNIIRIIILW
jgi:hypothetical protein